MMIPYATTVSIFLFIFSCSSLAFPGLKGLQQREICYETDTLLSFQLNIADSVPYCSSLLSISDSTTLEGPTISHTTTISTVTTTSYDTVVKVTVAQFTAFTTTTTTSGDKLHKRQDNVSDVPFVVAPVPIIATATAVDPIVTKFPNIAQNASIAAEAYSACSCLSITSSTVTAQPTIQFTRTINGFDFETLGTTTITSGTTTLTATVIVLPLPVASHNVSDSTVSTPSLGYPLPGSLVPTSIPNFPFSGRPFHTLNITTISTSIPAGIFPSVNSTANSIIPISGRPTPTLNFTANPTLPRSGNSTLPRSGLLPMLTANSSANLTLPRPALFPLPTVNLTTNFNASLSGRLPPRILNTTGSGRLPLPSMNATGRPLSPTTGFLSLPTFNGTNRTLSLSGSALIPTGVTFPLSDRLPFLTLNATRPSVRVPFPTLNSTFLPATLLTGTAPPLSASGQPRLPLNVSSSSVPVSNTSTITPFQPVGTQISPVGCPTINNATFTTSSGDQYQLRCSVDYPGRSFVDLDEPDLEGCIQKCSNINAALSQTPCHGVSFLQYAAGVHCKLLSQPDLLEGTGNALAVSAVLFNGVAQPVVGVK